jgi:hypothetical protein
MIDRVAGLIILLAFVSGCMSSASYPKIGLQRSLYPGLGSLDAKGIEAAFEKRLTLRPPLAAGIVWLDDPDIRMFGTPQSDYVRTGILERTVTALQRPPFDRVSALPTTVDLQIGADGAPSLDAVRSAAATFQYDVAFILQTGSSRATGLNWFALGYIPLITAPLFPGSDASVAAGAELCAVDVRSGIMLGCGVGRSRDEDRYLFPFTVDEHEERLREEVLTQAIAVAVSDVVGQLEQRLAR